MNTFWIKTNDAGYSEWWICVKLTDGTIKPVNGPFRFKKDQYARTK